MPASSAMPAVVVRSIPSRTATWTAARRSRSQVGQSRKHPSGCGCVAPMAPTLPPAIPSCETCMFLPVARRAGTGRREPPQLPPGRHGLPRAFVVEDQRERILSAVGDVVSVAGYREMSVEDVIVTAGVSRRTFYEHFKNKEDAFLAAYDAVLLQLLSAVRAAYESREGFAERVRAGIEMFLMLLAADPAFARMCIVEVMAAGAEAVQRRNEAMQAFAAMIEENAQQRLSQPPPSKLTAETVVGGIYEVVYTRIQRGDVRMLPELAPQLVQTALVHYLGPEAAQGAEPPGPTQALAREAPGAASPARPRAP